MVYTYIEPITKSNHKKKKSQKLTISLAFSDLMERNKREHAYS